MKTNKIGGNSKIEANKLDCLMCSLDSVRYERDKGRNDF